MPVSISYSMYGCINDFVRYLVRFSEENRLNFVESGFKNTFNSTRQYTYTHKTQRLGMTYRMGRKINSYRTIKQVLNTKYEGRSINKLQNSVILLFFKNIKIRNIRFVGNLILSTSCEFYHYDVTVTQVINNNYGNIAVKVVP